MLASSSSSCVRGPASAAATAAAPSISGRALVSPPRANVLVVGGRRSFAPCRAAKEVTVTAPSTSGRALTAPRAVLLAGGARRSSAPVCRAAKEVTVATTFVSSPDGAELARLDISGATVLRTQMLANKIDLYTTWGNVANCGGGGNCGTCIVDVKAAPQDCLSPKNETENKKLRGKPATYRLACQTFVGDEQTRGQSATIATKPK